jgi:hypothetical protein
MLKSEQLFYHVFFCWLQQCVIASALQSNPEASQAGRRVTRGDFLVFIAQALVKAPQGFAVFNMQPIFKDLTEESDAIVGTSIDSQQTASLSEERTGTIEIRLWRGFICEQISQQVRQGHMVSAATAAGAVTSGTGIKPASFAKELIQLDLERCNKSNPLSEPRPLACVQTRHVERYSS